MVRRSVPQNGNLNYNMQNILFKNRQVKNIIMKYCGPGHSLIQEVDTMHSIIERPLKNQIVYSPLKLVKKGQSKTSTSIRGHSVAAITFSEFLGMLEN